jgi:beta-aspartyl-dipeptidase (metallo-type)
LLEGGAPPHKITLSSDAGGSLPVYVDGELVGLTAASPNALPTVLIGLLAEHPDLFPIALAGMTRNPAAALRLKAAGTVREGGRADLLLLDPTNGVESVMCGGRWLLRDGEFLPQAQFAAQA